MLARSRLLLTTALVTAAALAGQACSDTPRANNPDGGGDSGGAGGSGGGGGAAELAPPVPSGLAVVNGDFSSTSVSLLTVAGELAKGDCIHTTLVNGSATISGDVVLPSQPQRGGKIVLIDRGNTALTFVDAASCTVDHQISVKGGFNHSNPHDVVILGDGKAYVTRYEKNAAPAGATTVGDDVLVIDPRDGTVLGNIDLSSYAVPVSGTTIQARPDRAVIAAGKVVVSLNEFSGDFSTYAEGHLVVIDPSTDQVVQDLALGGLKGCEAMTTLPDAKLLLVVCGGSFGADPASDSGLAVVDLSGPAPVLTGTIPAAGFDHHPASFQGITALSAGGSRRAFISTMGTFATDTSDAVPDEAFVVDLDGGAAVRFASSTAFDLGGAALAGANLLLPDATASMPRMHVVDVSGAPTETGSFVTDSANGLPPRLVAAY